MEKAVVLASGGMDSAVSLAIAARDFELYLMHFSYGQLTESREREAFEKIADHYHPRERKIITIEDPVEYQLRGINQIQVSRKAGLSFAKGLRSILRHDPDVILIGEIRDRETAEIAVQASLTGHLVFSTLHTNDAPGSLTRLVDMGVEPYLVASTLEGVIAQRLVRQICPECRDEFVPKNLEILKQEFTKMDWEAEPNVFGEEVDAYAKMDFLKDRIGIEVGFGHSSFLGIDLLKFQVGSYSGLDKIDVGVYVVTTSNFQKVMIKEYNQKWEGSLPYEKVLRYLPHFKSAIQVPIYVIGIDL